MNAEYSESLVSDACSEFDLSVNHHIHVGTFLNASI